MEWLIERFKANTKHTAFIHEGDKFSYGNVVEFIDVFYLRLQDAGIQPGNTVVVMGDYSPEAFCMMMALWRRGCIVIPFTKNSVVEKSFALDISGCDWHIDFNMTGHEAKISYLGLKNDNDLLNKFCQQNLPGLILFTSGSTGEPKSILYDFNQVCEKFRTQRAAVIAIPFLMMDHFGGINTILAITSGNGTVVTVANRSVDNICAAIERYKVDLLPATPSFLTLMMASNAQKKYNLSSIKRITYGTEVMPQLTLDRVCKQFPNVELLQTYGLSEVGVLRSQSRENNSLWVRIGGNGFQTKVVDGVLWIKSQYAMIGYLNASAELDLDGWFNTQDQVETDGDYFKILGRTTDIINVGGQKVYPSEIEDIILSLDNIKDTSVFGEKNALLGQIIVARIILNTPEAVASVKKRVRHACIEKLSSFKVPTKIILTNEVLHNSRHKKIRC